MDTEGQDVPLLSPLPGTADSIKVFPFIVHLKRDVIVSQRQLGLPFPSPTFFFRTPPILGMELVEEHRSVSLSLDAARVPKIAISTDTALSWELVGVLPVLGVTPLTITS